jgi:Family of unknown function (DUF6345)
VNRKNVRNCIGVLLRVACFLLPAAFAVAQTQSIKFAVPVPAAPASMQVYKLTATKAPMDFLAEKLRAGKLPAMKMEQRLYISRSTDPNDPVVRAYADPVSGDTHLIPNMAELVSGAKPAAPIVLRRSQEIARVALTDVRFIPKDMTELRFLTPIPIVGGATASATAGTTAVTAPAHTEPLTVLTMFPAVRYAGGFRVYGRGSHALVSVANNGAIVGALRRWRTASEGETVATSITADQVKASIMRQLNAQVATKGNTAVVDKIEVAYYDANANYLQPVYYFAATITSADRGPSPVRIAGYVPMGKALEAIPDLTTPAVGDRPVEAAQKMTVPKDKKKPMGTGLPAVTLGEYANRDWPNNDSYVKMANTFLSGLQDANGDIPTNVRARIVRKQWYEAHPFEVLSESGSYLNAMNIAYTVPHGNWLWNSTISNNYDPWTIPQIGTGGNPGFGAATGGKLSTWVIMSCEVIPSMYDREHQAGGTGNKYVAFDAWWPVFQGLHNAIGFRTIMKYPDDDLQYDFGYDAAVGGDVNAAWFQDVASDDGDDGTYAATHLTGKPNIHYDRASTMIDSRDLGHSIYAVNAQTPSTKLWNFWMDN